MDQKMPAQWKKSPPELVDFFNKALENHPELEKRKMFGYPCAFLGGNMFFGLFANSVFLRFSEEDLAKIKSLGFAIAFEPLPGRPMKEYATLDPKVTSDIYLFQGWLKKSMDYASCLPVKVKKGGKK
jgi:TfoX/Sxy family transcriptional regulator of competence genes